MVSVNEFGYPVPPKDFAQTFRRYGVNIGRTIGGLVPTASGVALGAIPAGIAALGAGYAMHRGNQMANDPAVANRMQNMRDLMVQGYIPTDEEGVWMDPEGNTVNLSFREELSASPSVTVNPYQNLSNLSQITQPTSVSSVVSAPITATPDQVEKTPVLQTDKSSQPTVKKASPGTNTQATSSGSRKNTQSKIDLSSFNSGSNDRPRTGSLDWLNELLPLLAAGGLGYLLAK